MEAQNTLEASHGPPSQLDLCAMNHRVLIGPHCAMKHNTHCILRKNVAMNVTYLNYWSMWSHDDQLDELRSWFLFKNDIIFLRVGSCTMGLGDSPSTMSVLC